MSFNSVAEDSSLARCGARFVLSTLAIVLTIAACNNHTNGPTDTTRPAPVSDLRITNVTDGKITLAWTATGDDHDEGKASYYDLRSAPDSSTLRNWGGARQQQGEPVPSVYGEEEQMMLPDTFSVTTYFALKVSDEATNTSSISNIVFRHR